MNYYEIPICIQAEVPYQGIVTISKKIDDLISKFSGSVLKCEYWRIRELAYQIRKSKKGRYYYLVVQADPQFPATLRRYLNMNEAILRFGVYRVLKPNMENSPVMEKLKKDVPEIPQDEKPFSTVFSDSKGSRSGSRRGSRDRDGFDQEGSQSGE